MLKVLVAAAPPPASKVVAVPVAETAVAVEVQLSQLGVAGAPVEEEEVLVTFLGELAAS